MHESDSMTSKGGLMLTFTSKQDFCSWLSQFTHPNLVADWASTAGIVSVARRARL